ncbi:MAG: hypothetical protein IPJ81_19025 [Chitinophagaceae bacterium]|nr:hypothetical protein [Chitinophagaceae bacterium]
MNIILRERFENIMIEAVKLDVEIVSELNKDILLHDTPYTGIWHNMKVDGIPDYKNLVGNLYIIFKNQSEKDNSALYLSGSFVVRADKSTEVADSFNKLIQHLFDWATKHVEEKNIVGEDGSKFIVPKFLYSKYDFEHLNQIDQ